MVINENNSLINSFVKGMNSDASFDQVPNEQYIFGENIRITKNQLLGNSGTYATVHEGIVTPVPSGEGCGGWNIGTKKERILAVQSVDRLSIIITTTIDIDLNDEEVELKDMTIYKFYMDETTDLPSSTLTKVWHCDNVWKDKVPEKISTVLYKELQNVIKLYIATGEHPIISLRIDDDSDGKYKDENDNYTSIDALINNREVPVNRVYIDNVISGKLTTSLVQYTYRYYNKYGNTTQLAPLTNKIQVIDPSRTKEVGNAEDTQTSIGFALKIELGDFNKFYDRLQIFRLSYIKPGQDSEIDLIYDGLINGDEDNDETVFLFNDIGTISLQTYSMEEFAAMSGIILIPQVIEQNQEYMFCANVKDDTIIKDAEKLDPSTIDPSNTTKFELISADVVLSDNIQGDIPNPGNHSYMSEYYEMHGVRLNGNTYSTPYMDVQKYLELHSINPEVARASYNDIITSSLLRSLRRGETYRYAIVFYDDKGRRTDVIDLCDVNVPDYLVYTPFAIENSKLIARPVGVNLLLPYLTGLDDDTKIIGCLIVRRSSSDVYQKNLLLVALARPISQAILDVNITGISDIADAVTKKSPFYPSGLLSVNNIEIYPTYYNRDNVEFNSDLYAKTRNHKLYQIFSSEIDFRRDDVLSRINVSDTSITEMYYVYAVFSKYTNNTKDNTYSSNLPDSMSKVASGEWTDRYIAINRSKVERLSIDAKEARHWIFNFYNSVSGNEHSRFGNYSDNGAYKINQIKDVKIPEWNSGFTEVQRVPMGENGDELALYTAIKKYKSYSTNIDSFTYNNWISFAKYDFRAGVESLANVEPDNNWYGVEMLSDPDKYKKWMDANEATKDEDKESSSTFHSEDIRCGYIGPGSSCFLLTTEKETGGFPPYDAGGIFTSICNIHHEPELLDVESKEYVQYFGFGNFFKLREYRQVDGNGNKYRLFTTPSDGRTFVTVFDGDVYITPHELTTMYKAYDFNSGDTLQSTQIVNYVPLESKVNTYFDYGMNMMNTHSENLMYEPGYIDGINTQDRPAHLYNMIYSDNDSSNDVFTLISTDKNETNEFKQRSYYSDLKTNGEFIDNFLIFKPVSFIDVDSRYGEITNLLTDKNNLYYWQDHACGKFSVNERSLINDQNNNTIMLGQAGILSRYDYISTKYGMRLYDFCARSVDSGGIFWADINNKAVAAISSNGVVNYGEVVNVQNIINNRIELSTLKRPYVDYDLQNDEVLCKCLTDGDQIIFNTKYSIATSLYTRRYDDMLYIKNHLYGVQIGKLEDFEVYTLSLTKHNYISNITSYLSPVQLQFIVNPIASVTKVFDSQQLIPIKRDSFSWYETTRPEELLKNTVFSFETDIVSKEFGENMEPHTDREGNIIYNIPRYTNELGYGNRIRGKWLRVNIKSTEPESLLTISHVLTKFRQSYS